MASTPRTGRGGGWRWWLLALVAQLAVDGGVSSLDEWLRVGRWPRLHLRELAVVAFVDATPAPIGLLAAAVAAAQPLAVFAVVPLGALIPRWRRSARRASSRPSS